MEAMVSQDKKYREYLFTQWDEKKTFRKFHHVLDIFEIRQIQKPHIYPFISTGTPDEEMSFQTISIG